MTAIKMTGLQELLQVKFQGIVTERGDPLIADVAMVESDELGQVSNAFLGDSAVVVGEQTTSVWRGLEFRGIFCRFANGCVNMDRLAVFGSPEEKDVLPECRDLFGIRLRFFLGHGVGLVRK